ncbi:serine protease [Exilibacterium tricleocarpae]|uniref:Serine protease n=1 Tax=Exilibacterium tricleocarpae TaxID=2591008 RepID=A0A545TZ39_9GAMM|nr:serine protease [Exilibacterium tricleocarpae]TQV82453.1 serine protease [Exilibacterium tricleocarpae]
MHYLALNTIRPVILSMGILFATATTANTFDNTNTKWPFGNFFNKALIYGTIYTDRNGNNRKDLFEKGLRDIVVYVDENNNGVRDTNEIATKTNIAGRYFLKIAKGDHIVRQEVPFGWRNTEGGEGEDTVPVTKDSEYRITPKIIGGKEVSIEQYPFTVALGRTFGDYFFHFCGGAFITDRWIVTASHCISYYSIDSIKVLAGTNDITDGSGYILDVEDVIMHPGYDFNPDPSYPSVWSGYDIALLKLSEPVALKENGLQSITMLTEEDQALAADGQLSTALGWGVSFIRSRLLKDVHLPVFDTAECQALVPNAINFDTQLCLGGALEGGIASCTGDSGSPVLVRDIDSAKWRLAGITSYGTGACAAPGVPGVAARVSALSEWVKGTAVSPSRHYELSLAPFKVVRANFGNRKTTYQTRQEIEPRWQLVNTAMTEQQDGYLFDWRIIDEAPYSREFDCAIDLDGEGELPSTELECLAGANSAIVPLYSEDGIYQPSMTASDENASYTRRFPRVTIGTPPEKSIQGILSTDDATNPDTAPSRHYIDYYNIEHLSGGKIVSIRVASESLPGISINVYDRDTRELEGGSGYIYFGGTNITFLPEADINYLIGVSSNTPEAVGSYTLTVVNDGTPVSTVLSFP